MKIFVKMGFRNIFRNKRRSLLTSIIIGLGIAAMILVDGFILGMSDNMVKTITDSFISEGQIHHPKFRDSWKSEYQIQNLAKVKKILQSDKQVAAFSERTVSFAMISSPKAIKNVTVFGIDPENEPKVTQIHHRVFEGEFVAHEDSLVIGTILQKRLNVALGDKVVLTSAKAGSGEISQMLFRISGIMKSKSKDLDEKAALIHIKKARQLLGMGSGIHEIGIKFQHRAQGEQLNNPLWDKLNVTGNLAESWKLVASSFVGLMKMVDESKAIVAFVLMFLVAFGIINTLFMALYERMFEFAVLRALGTKSREIFIMIVSEAGSLALISILTGLLITLVLAVPMYIWGIDYSGIEFGKVTIREPVHFVFRWYQFTWIPFFALLFTILISMYPALHAARIKMAEAIKRSM